MYDVVGPLQVVLSEIPFAIFCVITRYYRKNCDCFPVSHFFDATASQMFFQMFQRYYMSQMFMVDFFLRKYCTKKGVGASEQTNATNEKDNKNTPGCVNPYLQNGSSLFAEIVLKRGNFLWFSEKKI